jgi:integrase
VLHAIFATAVADELLTRSPCVLRGASTHRSPERPTVSIQQVFELADAIDPTLRAMVLLATFTGLRLGELRALRRSRLDLVKGTVTVVEQLQELSSGEQILGPPKTDAGVRTVAIPAGLLEALAAHMERFTGLGLDDFVFCSSIGQPLGRKTFYRHWGRAVSELGLAGFRFHDLRHTSNTLAATTGASTKELMARMGHASPRAALIYQHATSDRDTELAAALNRLIEHLVEGPHE